MNSCSLGAPRARICATNFSRLRCGNLLIPNNQRLFIDQSPIKNLSLRTTLRSVKAIQLSTLPPAETRAIADVEDSEETKPTVLNTQLIPKSSEVEALISEITDSTSIAEFELKLGGFRLYVARKLADQSSPPPQQIPPVVAASATPEGVHTNGSATSSSLAITKTSPSSADRPQTLANKAADQGLVILQSPTVGYFRRSKTIKGKRTPTICKEKDIVKEGQVLCYIEQLGGQIPVESDVSGEIVKILREDGEPVGYNDALITVLPSFPGIKKLQ
ncbi:Biotin/lipoyl attachment [Arabidopsis thaliana x Arabidopsis arenosa]|uniref:Biotin/lipoyl attachment n=1 Tax=Arabidopsis thaliana x Arabidopsis arenosa TaxID=1240361 RepID=A0A8T2C9N0_9BRAS|nr:Biotin/lipoyl attachment [Arabidopsis thaliana x Arabidopsis arenosa]